MPASCSTNFRAKPVIPFTKSAPPPRLVPFAQARRTYSDLDTNVISPTLHRDQAGRCAYCGRPLGTVTRVEHFHPQSQAVAGQDCQEQSGVKSGGNADVSWPNLLLCCNGGQAQSDRGAAKDTHCDVAKGSIDVCQEFPNPAVYTGGATVLVRARKDGSLVIAVPVKDEARAQRVIDTVLNLNCEELRDERRESLRVLMTDYHRRAGRRRSRAEVKKEILALIENQDRPDLHTLLFRDVLRHGYAA